MHKIPSGWFILILCFFTINLKAETVYLNENLVLSLAQKSLPEWSKIEAMELQGQMEERLQKERLAPELFAGASWEENKAKTLTDFQPIYSPTKGIEGGVRQNFKYGLSAQLGLGVDQRTGKSPTLYQKDASTVWGQALFQVDLWKDFLGKSTLANLKNAEAGAEKTKLQKEIQKKAYVQGLRKSFWAIVANQLATDISQELLSQAERQAIEAKKRMANYVADEGEVARYQAQASSRRSLLLTLNYRRQNLLKQMRLMIPALGDKDLVLDKIDVEKTIQEVLACSATIASRPNTPFENTQHDELIALIRSQSENKKQVINGYSDIDLKLKASLKSTGVDRGLTDDGRLSRAFDEMHSGQYTGKRLALELTIPIGSEKSTTEEVQKKLEEKRTQSEIEVLESNLIATHAQLKNSVSILLNVIKNQNENAEHLRKRLSVQQRKFTQARVSVVDLINDQDSLLSSELDVINSKLEILNTLLDYLAIFTETPCTFNRTI